jgi:hypothetical protein
MFLVTMTLAVLASVGLYSLAAATSEIRTSGSARQATQTHYLAEYGVVASAQYMTASRAQTYINNMISSPDTGCYSLPNVTATTQPDKTFRACSHVLDPELASAQGWAAATFPSYGTPGTATTPDFLVEFAGLTKATNTPRYALDLHMCFVQMTASAYGTTTPATSLSFGEGFETARARILAGPVSGAICQ